MSKRLNQKRAIKLLEQHGWTRSTGGKHVVKMIKPGHRPITLPACKREDYSAGLTASIKRVAGID